MVHAAPGSQRARPARLSRDLVVEAAVAVADSAGLGAVSMRRLATDLGVDPMSLYRYVDGKDDLLDAMTDSVVAGIEPVADTDDWKAAARATMLSARATMLRHPWTLAVRRARKSPTPAELRHLDGLLGILRGAGFDLALTHHAVHVLGSRVLGFSEDLYDDGGDEGDTEPAPAQAAAWAEAHPHLAELAGAATHDGVLGPCDDDAEFRFALDLTLDGLEARLTASRG
jgi:AcrR family transcriptional regulator